MGLADDLATLTNRRTFPQIVEGMTDDEHEAFMVALGGDFDAVQIADVLERNGLGLELVDLPQAVRNYRLKLRREGII